MARKRPLALKRNDCTSRTISVIPLTRLRTATALRIGRLAVVRLSRTAGLTPMAYASHFESGVNDGLDAYSTAIVVSRGPPPIRSSFSSLTRLTT
jgi:hypothetical protein